MRSPGLSVSRAHPLARTSLGGEVDDGLAQGLRIGNPLRKGQAQCRIAERKVEAVGIKPGEPPLTIIGL